VHRDIKPSNIFIEEAGVGRFTSKVTDFGVSLLVSHGITDGVMTGTPSYLSPEEIQGTAVDGRSDQFSLAIVIYEAFSGTKPFIADSLPAIFYQICTQAPRPVEQVNASLTAAVGAVLNRALAKNPSQRFPTCTDFVEALGEALQEGPGWVAAPIAVRETPPPPAAKQRIPEAEPALHLPSLPKRRSSIDDEEVKEPQKHSPLTLLALMLALSAVVIAITVLFGNWDWVSLFSRTATSSAPAATPSHEGAGARQSAATPKPEQQKPAQPNVATNEPTRSPVNSNPVAGPPPVQLPAKVPEPAKPSAKPSTRQGKSSPVPGAVAAVDLLSEPPGATIVIDGNRSTSCVAPCTIALPVGRHTATFELNGYNLARRVFTVPEESSIITPLGTSSGTLVVTSTPAGSTIFVDNKPAGSTPATLHLQAGRHTLVLVNGQMRHQETLEIEPGVLQTRSLRWQ
jgi:serine/threonine protein kinase